MILREALGAGRAPSTMLKSYRIKCAVHNKYCPASDGAAGALALGEVMEKNCAMPLNIQQITLLTCWIGGHH